MPKTHRAPNSKVENATPPALEEAPVEATSPEEDRPQGDRFLEDGFPNPKTLSAWEYLQLLTDAQWDHHAVYLYRSKPRTSKLESSRGAYIKIYTRAFTIEDVKGEFGGGGYKIYINRDSKTVLQHNFEIAGAPKKMAEDASAEAGKDTVAANATSDDLLRKLVADVITQRDKASEDGKQFDPAIALENSLALYGKASEAAIELVAKNSGGEGIADKMIGLLMPKLMDRLLNPEPAPDPLAQLSATAELLKSLQGEPAAGDGPGNWKIALAQSIGSKIDMLANAWVKGTENLARREENRAAVTLAGRGFTVRTTPPVGAPATTEPLQASATDTPAAPPPIAPSATEPATSEPAPQLSMPDFIKGKLVEMLITGKNGDAAAIFAETMDTPFAEQLARMMKENPEALAKDNILAQAVRHPNVKTFCKDYVDYFEEEGSLEETPPPPAGDE